MSSVRRKEAWRKYNAKRRADPMYREKQKLRYKLWAKKNARDPKRLAKKAAQMRSYSKDPILAERMKARRAVRSAIESGRLFRGCCEVCGIEKSQAHHEDYSKPLDIRWLCRTHHNEHHAKATGAT